MGKGSKRRPISVPLAKFKANWDRIFKQTTKDKEMLVLYTEKQLEEAYETFLEDYEGTIVPDLETFRILYEASEELQGLVRREKNEAQLRHEEKVFEIVFEPEEELVESCGGTPAGFIPENTSIH